MKMQGQFRKQQEAVRLMDEEHDEWLRRVQLDEHLVTLSIYSFHINFDKSN